PSGMDTPWARSPPAWGLENTARTAATWKAKGRFSGAATANGAMRTLRSIYNYAAETDQSLPANPVRTMRRSWYAVPRRERHVKADELGLFLRAVRALPNPIHADYLELLLLTGLRRQEAAALEWGDVDMGARVVRIPAVRAKSGKKLDLPMSDLVYDLLARRRALGNTRFVFPSDSSTSGHLIEPKTSLELVAKTCGIEVSCHDL